MKRTYKTSKQLLPLLLIIALSACGGKQKGKTNAETQSITVYAAASLTDVLSEIVDSFEVKTGTKVITNMASSGTLARQIEQGEIPDVYLSASKKWGDYVDSLGHKCKDYKKIIARNDLVLIAPADSKLEALQIDSTLNIPTLLGDWRLSMGDPLHVPAGKYAKQALSYYGWYAGLTNKILPAKDVRSALMVVEMGEAPLGIVYRTDAQKSKKVKVIATFPQESHKPIAYVALVCQEGDVAIDFYSYLNSEAMQGIWTKYGFQN